MTVIVLDCCEHPAAAPRPRRRRLALLARVAAATATGAYLGATCCAAAGSLFGALIREALR